MKVDGRCHCGYIRYEAEVDPDTVAICTVSSKNGGHRITRMELHVRAEVPGIRETVFQELVTEADQSCPVSNLLRGVLEIEILATLI